MHELALQKDNAPAYLLALDSLLLEVTISYKKLEGVFSKQMEQSTQLEEVMKLYSKGVMKRTNPQTYNYLRGEIDLHLSLERKT